MIEQFIDDSVIRRMMQSIESFNPLRHSPNHQSSVNRSIINRQSQMGTRRI
jgi:hypothetical protein